MSVTNDIIPIKSSILNIKYYYQLNMLSLIGGLIWKTLYIRQYLQKSIFNHLLVINQYKKGDVSKKKGCDSEKKFVLLVWTRGRILG